MLAVALAAIAAALPAPDVAFVHEFEPPGKWTTFTRLELRGLPRDTTLDVRCRTPAGRRCPGRLGRLYSRFYVRGTVELTRFTNRRFRAGRSLEARIAAPGYETQYKTLHVKRDRRPRLTTVCGNIGPVSEQYPC